MFQLEFAAIFVKDNRFWDKFATTMIIIGYSPNINPRGTVGHCGYIIMQCNFENALYSSNANYL